MLKTVILLYIAIHSNIFNHNLVTNKGSALYLVTTNLNSSGFLELQNNVANTGVLYAVQSTLCLSGNTTVSNNYGSLFVYSCNLTFIGNTDVVNNSYISNKTEEGGAITGFQSEIVFTSTVKITHNMAMQGGGIAVTQSKLYVYGDISVSQNAALSGGGIYLCLPE